MWQGRSVASIYAHKPCLHVQLKYWKRIFFFRKMHLFIIKSWWQILVSPSIGVFVFSISFIPLFHNSDSVTSLFPPVNTVPTTLKFTTNYCIFLLINLPETSCEKRWKWRFQDPKIKTFLVEHAPRTPWVGPPSAPRLFPSASVHLQNLTLDHCRLFIFHPNPESNRS